MRAETPGARTWLLGAVALWALVAWLLGLFGLGGRIDRLPPDPSLVQALPAVLQPGEGRLGPLAQYAEFGDRPLFTTDRRPQPFIINPEEEAATAEFEFVLTSVLLAPGLEVAILQPAEGGESVRVKVGETAEAAPGWHLSSLSPRSAVFDGPDGQRTLELRVFDGVGGAPPTSLATTGEGQGPRRGPQEAGQGAEGRSTAVPSRRRDDPARAAPPGPPTGTTATAGEAPPPAEPETGPDAEVDSPTVPDEQVDAIRRRIEARRARLREDAQQGR